MQAAAILATFYFKHDESKMVFPDKFIYKVKISVYISLYLLQILKTLVGSAAPCTNLPPTHLL